MLGSCKLNCQINKGKKYYICTEFTKKCKEAVRIWSLYTILKGDKVGKKLDRGKGVWGVWKEGKLWASD